MRRMLILLLAIFLASGAIVGSIAHVVEIRGEASLLMTGTEPGCLPTPVSDSAESEKKSSSGDQNQKKMSFAPHGCHGHHAGVPTQTLIASSEIPLSQSHARMMATTLPPAAFFGMFRPPIA